MSPTLSTATQSCGIIFSQKNWDSRSALEIIYSDDSIPWNLRSKIGNELGQFGYLKFRKKSAVLKQETIDALTYLLYESSTPHLTKDSFREALIHSVPQIMPLSKALDLLLPIARGVTLTTPMDLIFANKAIQRLSLLEEYSKISNTHQNVSQDLFSNAKIISVSPLGGGYNTTLLVKFENGLKAIFKPLLGQNNLGDRNNWSSNVAFVREVSAVAIIEKYLGNKKSRQLGYSQIITPNTIETILVHNDKSYGLGSLQMFLPEFETLTSIKNKSLFDSDRILNSTHWKSQESRIRIFDFVLGNPDRLPNPGYRDLNFAQANYSNIMIANNKREELIQIALIDNAMGRPGPVEMSSHYLPSADQIPNDLRFAIFNFNAKEFREEMYNILPKQGIEDLITRVHIVKEYILDGETK